MKNILSFLFLIFFCLLYFAQVRVGIDTEKPTNTLDVNGDVRIRTTEEINNIPEFVLTSDDKGVVQRISSDLLKNGNNSINGDYAKVVSFVNFTENINGNKIDPINFLSYDYSIANPTKTNIRVVKWNQISSELLGSNIMTYSTKDFFFTTLKNGFYQFTINLVCKGPAPENGIMRIGLSKPITNYINTLDNSSFAFFSQYDNVTAGASDPLTLLSTGTVYLKKGEKVVVLTRYLNPSIQTVGGDGSYNISSISSVVVKYFPE